eukprot:scaffold10136_cov58-Phaeocystis_antarctica.AAC.1
MLTLSTGPCILSSTAARNFSGITGCRPHIRARSCIVAAPMASAASDVPAAQRLRSSASAARRQRRRSCEQLAARLTRERVVQDGPSACSMIASGRSSSCRQRPDMRVGSERVGKKFGEEQRTEVQTNARLTYRHGTSRPTSCHRQYAPPPAPSSRLATLRRGQRGATPAARGWAGVASPRSAAAPA